MNKKLLPTLILSLLFGCSSVQPVDKPAFVKEFHTNTPRPTVIIVHGCDGVDNISYTNWAKEINSWGYNTIVSDSFKVRGVNTGVCGNPIYVMPKERTEDLIKLATYIRTQSWHEGKIAVIGFSHGGSTVLNLANTNQNVIDIAIAYYPSCHKWFAGLENYHPTIPVQVHLAERDDWTPISECEFLPSKDKYLYKNATHAFDMQYPDRTYNGHHLSYNKQADILSKERTKEFLSNQLH